MLPIIQQPRLNPIKFVDVEQPVDARIHSPNWLSDWYYNQLRAWEDKQPFLQPFQFNDRIRLQFNSSSDDAVSMQVLDCYGTIRATFYPANIFDLPGNNCRYTGVHLFNCYFRTTFSEMGGLPAGVYFLLVSAGTDDAKTQMVSEPIEVAEDHPDTLLLQYRYDENKDDCVFEQSNCVFNLRVPGAVGRPLPDFEYNSYKDQDNNTTALSGKAGRTFEIFFDQITPELHDTINHALLCNFFQVEDTQYAMDESSKWDEGVTAGVALRSPSIVVRESDPARNSTHISGGEVLVATFPLDTPYFIVSVSMGRGTANTALPAMRFIQVVPTDLEAYVTDLNVAAASLDLSGTFSLVTLVRGYQLIYTNAPSEYYDASASQVLTDYITLGITTTGSAQSFSFQFTQGLIAVVWGDGSTGTYLSLSTFSSAIHQYATAGTRTVYVLGTFTRLYLTVTSTARFCTSIGGKFPAGLLELKVQGSAITAFSAATLANTAESITTLQLTDGALGSLTGLVSYAFTRLANFSVSGNVLSSGAVSNLYQIISINAVAYNLRNGAISTALQRPAAPLTPDGIIARNQLISRGWTAYSD